MSKQIENKQTKAVQTKPDEVKLENPKEVSSSSSGWKFMDNFKANSNQKNCNSCPYQNFIRNPYDKNEYGYDALTELSWRLTLWKKENVFPLDLKLRAPAVFLSTLLIMKGFFIRI